jgi:peptide/nickel transport system substrate-binding protein
MLIRYKRQIVTAFFVGITLVLVGWRLIPKIQAIFFPRTQIIGIIGSYQPAKLPLRVQRLISAGFTSINEQGVPEPLLATDWNVDEDGKRYFFHLEPNQYWHDGTSFTAFDVNYNFEDVVIAPADEKTLKVELEEPFAPLPGHLSRPLFKPGLIGVGPYKVVRLELNGETVKRLLLKPYDIPATTVNEAQGKTSIDFRFYPTMENAILAFQLGEIDILENVFSDIFFKDQPNVTITPKVQFDRFVAIFFDTKNELLKTKELRQALSYASPHVDGTAALSPISITSWAFNANIKDYKYNMELAKSLFEKAGIATESPTLTLTTFSDYLPLAEEVAKNWKELGIDTNVKVVPVLPTEYEAFLGVQEIPSDPDQYPLWHSTQPTNFTHYNNPKIDKLLEEGRKKTNKDERLSIYRDFQKYLVEDTPARFLIHPTVYTITRK